MSRSYSGLIGDDLDNTRALTPQQLISAAERIVYTRDWVAPNRLYGVISRLELFLSNGDFMLSGISNASTKSNLEDKARLVIAAAKEKLNKRDGRGKKRKNTMRKQPKKRRGTRRVR